ncbi:beta-galactosidase trimerization domain-containing protein [Paenibacillus sp. PL91]|uniref:beta-galactosidase trimerization domain-containing protein n=1 Tax=Paenibacillus sp. PL91 TaxID=2729538 RepID=UPI00145FB17C|nr:beta-galactosidase trimerization domain-containing protein [Paenibacillus sp. PL91]MBC9200381.1 beta-galactosidase trimerization domain-containing protein [Paenibacillus sp. PL91]
MKKRFKPIGFRQVHLDFHTSEHITGVGRDFDEGQFIASLKQAKIDTLNVFAMCHHGWSYYDTAVGKPHPHLETNLLPRMLEACKQNDIEAPIYITVGFNELAAREHPEWVVVKEDGDPYGPPKATKETSLPTGWDGWHMLCLNSPYLQYILDYTREVMERFQPVGIFYDIVGEYPCLCASCRSSLKEQGLDENNPEHRMQLAKQTYLNYLKATSELIWSINPVTRLYHNCTTERMGDKQYHEYYSHYDIESLPTGGWGYDYFTSMVRYIRKQDFQFLGMTGKFHKSWGEFGGFKSPAALRYECQQMISFGARICVGDQLHPSGRMDEETYRIIGEAFEDVEAKEEWCRDTESIAEIAILSANALNGAEDSRTSDMGAYMMLEEGHYLFDMIDDLADFSAYRILILPDQIRLNDALQQKLERYAEGGGKIILSAQSGLRADRDEFALAVGAEFQGKSEWELDYTLVSKQLGDRLVSSPFINYESGYRVAVGGAEVLANSYRPYFNRTYGHFCSHLHAPAAEEAGYPAVIQHENIVYIAQPLFRLYRNHGMQLYKDLLLNIIKQLLPEPILTTSLPSAGKVNLTRLAGESDYVLHLLYAVPILRGDTQVIEDVPALSDISIRVKLDKAVKGVRLLPEMADVPFVQDEEGYTSISVNLHSHRMVQFKV